jgi:taurine--2-oxoglutarate transaminase
MGVSDAIAAHFKKNVFWGGLTYNAHAFALATAEAVLDVLIDEDLVQDSRTGLEVRIRAGEQVGRRASGR